MADRKKRAAPKRAKVEKLLADGGLSAKEIAEKIGCTPAYVRLVGAAIGKSAKRVKKHKPKAVAKKAAKKFKKKGSGAKKRTPLKKAKKKRPYKRAAVTSPNGSVTRSVDFRLVKTTETMKKGLLVITSTYQPV